MTAPANNLFRRLHKWASRQDENFLTESLAGVRSIRNFAVEDRQQAEFERCNDAAALGLRAASWSTSIYVPIVQAIGLTALALVVLYGGEQAIAGSIAIGVVVSFMAYLRTMLNTLPDLATVISQFFQCGAALDRILGLLDLPAEERERTAAPPLHIERGAVAVEGVWFRYAALSA